jgi:hypothetical protein
MMPRRVADELHAILERLDAVVQACQKTEWERKARQARATAEALLLDLPR